LRERKLLVEPEKLSVKVRRRRYSRPYAVRKPKGWKVERPGDLVQVDTVDLNRHLQEHRKQFTARDMVSRWDVIEAHTRASASLAAGFLDTLERESPYPIKAIQVDGGSEFAVEFEQACKNRDIRLFELPPRSPKLNGRVERAQRTHREEYYERHDIPQTIEDHNQDLKRWQDVYNMIRPHQALGQRTLATSTLTQGADYCTSLAADTLSVLPILAMYAAMHRRMVQGILEGSGKET